MSVYEGPLGMIPPTDDEHIQKYSLTAGTMPTEPTPVVFFINWYTAFDRPVKDNRGIYWIKAGNLGSVRGGHAICTLPRGVNDLDAWHEFYNQGTEGACVGFSISRQGSLLNRYRYGGFPLYYQARKVDEWPGENYDGTSGRAGYDVARDKGLWRVKRGVVSPNPSWDDGFHANRWATSINEIAACLSPGTSGKAILDHGYITLLNSWGVNYPHYVRMDLNVVQRIIFAENGEASVVTDR